MIKLILFYKIKFISWKN